MQAKVGMIHGNEMILTIMRTGSEKFKLDEIVEIRKTKSRSLQANSLYWIFLTFALPYYREHAPEWTETLLHEYFKNALIPIQRVSVGDFEFEVQKTTTAMNVREFWTYFENVFSKSIEDACVPVNEFQRQYEEVKWGDYVR